MQKRSLMWIIFLLIAPGAISQTDIDWKKLHKDLIRLDSCLEVGMLADSMLMVYDSQLVEYRAMVAMLEVKNTLSQNHVDGLNDYITDLDKQIQKQQAQIMRQQGISRILGGISAGAIIFIILNLLI